MGEDQLQGKAKKVAVSSTPGAFGVLATFSVKKATGPIARGYCEFFGTVASIGQRPDGRDGGVPPHPP